ncbi:helix-turn-helix transcriptional regulator [Glutamicibacter sp.]|uniref:helix-turn-helix transcriptional regulator n=1 Tax=Glutamicibacter sp. TaxID=1931995 RepID=UPI002FD96368
MSVNNAQNVQRLWGDAKFLTKSKDIPANTIGRILSDPQLSGAVVSGPTGSGRRAVVEAGLGLLSEAPRLIRLNGSNFGTKVPLGVLSFLLAQLDVGSQATRHELIHGLGKILCLENSAALVMLGRPDLIDEQSSSLLAQLAVMGKIKLVVICEHVQDLPGDLFALFRSGKLEQLRVSRMDSTQTHEFLEQELGGQISIYSSATLCYLTNGNRGLMLKLVRSWCVNGQLVQQHGVWVLRSAELGAGQEIQSLSSSLTAGMTAAERELLTILSLGGPVALDRVHLSGLTAPLDGLLNRGVVKYLHESTNSVAIATPLLGLMMRADAGGKPKASDRTRLAQLHPDPDAAQTLEALRELKDIGKYADQLALAEKFQSHGYGPAGWQIDPLVRVGILKMHVNALTLVGRQSATPEAIGYAWQGLRLAINESGAREPLILAGQELEVLSQMSLLSEDEMTNSSGVIGGTEVLAGSSNWMSESLHLRALAIQAKGWAAQSRQADATSLAGHVDDQLRAIRFNAPLVSRFGPEDVADIEQLLLQTELLAGHWKLAASRAQKLAAGSQLNPLLMAHAQTVHGILLGLGNDHEGALRVLEPCLQQQSYQGDQSLRCAVESVVTYALACSGRRLEATTLMANGPSEAQNTSTPINFYTWTSEVFSSLSLAELGSKDVAQARLTQFAQQIQGEGHQVLQMLTLAFAVRLGHWDSLPQLEVVSRRCKGMLAQSLVQLAKSASEIDGVVLAQTLKTLAFHGHLLLAAPAHNELFSLLDAKEQRKLSKAVNGYKRASAPDNASLGERQIDSAEQQPSWVRDLTKREAQIAQLAIRGKSNLEIAKFNGVSIRTVEGHLYQVYSKLQVRNRQELTALDRSSRRTVAQR